MCPKGTGGSTSDGLNKAVSLPRETTMNKFYVLHSAEELRQRIHLTLSLDPHVGSRQVNFKLINRDVLLTGTVKTYYQKQMAQESLRRVEGIGGVVNQLEVVRD